MAGFQVICSERLRFENAQFCLAKSMVLSSGWMVSLTYTLRHLKQRLIEHNIIWTLWFIQQFTIWIPLKDKDIPRLLAKPLQRNGMTAIPKTRWPLFILQNVRPFENGMPSKNGMPSTIPYCILINTMECYANHSRLWRDSRNLQFFIELSFPLEYSPFSFFCLGFAISAWHQVK